MADLILVLNAGSSSLKFALFEIGEGFEPGLRLKGQIEDIEEAPRFIAKEASGGTLAEERWTDDALKPDGLISRLLAWIESRLGTDTLIAAGHRIVHGGREFSAPCVLDDAAIDALDALTPLAPLHQPKSLAPVRALKSLRPDLPQFGCFDTAFHHGLVPPVSRYAIPRAWEAKGIRRYGFHGLSYEHIAHRLSAMVPDMSAKRTIVAHLGNGASLCAMRDGKSVDTTMGFTALDGLMMGTRCGAIDPGVLLYLQQTEGLSVDEVERALYHESGLLGVSGVSSDMQTLLETDDPHAAEAVDLFVHMAVREIAAMAATLGGTDCLVFTGGLGEHAAKVRSLICDRLGFLGVEADQTANAAGAERIGVEDGSVMVLVVAADEEQTIARAVNRLLGVSSNRTLTPMLEQIAARNDEVTATGEPLVFTAGRERSFSLSGAYGREVMIISALTSLIAAVSLWRWAVN
jgi:acetate kinase